MQIEKIEINKIKPYENNAKLHPPEQIEQNKDLALNGANLITFCMYHYGLCNKEKIPINEVQQIIKEQKNYTDKLNYSNYWL